MAKNSRAKIRHANVHDQRIDVNTFNAVIDAAMQSGIPLGPNTFSDQHGQVQRAIRKRREIPYFNTGGTVPPYGLVQDVGVQGYFPFVIPACYQPFYDEQNGNVYVNGPLPAGPQDFGWAQGDEILVVLFDPADGTPVWGQSWGPVANSYKARRGHAGFRVIGVFDATNNLMLAQRENIQPSGASTQTLTPDEDPFNCAYPSADFTSLCHVCPCTADIWLLDIGVVTCGSAVLSTAALTYIGGDLYTCNWASQMITSAGRTFYWSMTLLSDFTASIQLIETTTNPITLAQWVNDKFCCACQNCFQAECPIYFPVPCINLPAKICLNPARCVALDVIAGVSCTVCSNTSVPRVYYVDLSTVTPGGCGTYAFGIGNAAFPGTTARTGNCDPVPQPFPLVWTGNCAWSASFGCANNTLPAEWDYTLSIGDPTQVVFTAQFIGAGVDCVLTYVCPWYAWNCGGDNTLNLKSFTYNGVEQGGRFIGCLPDTISVTAGLVVGQLPDTIILQNNMPIPCSATSGSCSGCKCCYNVNDGGHGTHIWLFNGTGAAQAATTCGSPYSACLEGTDSSIIALLGDPNGFPIGTVACVGANQG